MENNNTDQGKINFSITLPHQYNDNLQEKIIFKNVFSPDECRRIINSTSTSQTDQASLANGKVDLSIRNTLVRFFRYSQDFLWIGERVSRIVLDANQNNFGFNISYVSDMQLLEYRQGGYFGWHTDTGHAQSSTRKLSVIVFLSDPSEYEGGDILWCPYENVKIVQEQGSLVIFPSYIAHKVEEVTSGTRFSLVCWVHGTPFV